MWMMEMLCRRRLVGGSSGEGDARTRSQGVKASNTRTRLPHHHPVARPLRDIWARTWNNCVIYARQGEKYRSKDQIPNRCVVIAERKPEWKYAVVRVSCKVLQECDVPDDGNDDDDDDMITALVALLIICYRAAPPLPSPPRWFFLLASRLLAAEHQQQQRRQANHALDATAMMAQRACTQFITWNANDQRTKPYDGQITRCYCCYYCCSHFEQMCEMAFPKKGWWSRRSVHRALEENQSHLSIVCSSALYTVFGRQSPGVDWYIRSLI